MDPWVEKQDRKEMKKMKAQFDMLSFVADAQYGIPTKCPCGAQIIDDGPRPRTSPEPKYPGDFDTYPGRRYFTCMAYKDDGLHFRQPWVFGVQEEVRALRQEVNEMAKEIAVLKKLLTDE